MDSFILVKIISEAVNKKEKKMNCEKLIFWKNQKIYKKAQNINLHNCINSSVNKIEKKNFHKITRISQKIHLKNYEIIIFDKNEFHAYFT